MKSFSSMSLLALAGALAACTPAVTTAPLPLKLSPREQIARTVDSLISQPAFRTAQFGVLVVDPATGDTLVSRNAGKLFMPASNMKLITTAVALTQLGPEYRYRTTFAARGTIRDSVLNGDLVVIGRGDPSISDTSRGGDAMSVMEALADSIARHGIKRITGALVSGGNAFSDSTHGAGWEFDYFGDYYGAGVDELFFNDGMAPTKRRPGGGRDSLFSGPAPDPDRNYLNALDSALAHHGMAAAKGVASQSLDPLPPIDTLFVFSSLPLRDIFPALLKPSQNQIAEIFFKTIGLERGGAGTADSARKVVRKQLLDWGVLPDGFNIYDGSGLSRHDLLTPETIVRVLATVQRDTAFTMWYNALPIAGVDGTIRNRMKGTPAQNNVHAKTGTLGGASSLSGYVTTADGEHLIFSVLSNNFLTPTRSATAVQDAIAIALASYRSH